MQSVESIAKQLQALSDERTARARMREIHPLRGVRGVPTAKLARALDELFKAGPAALPRDTEALYNLFLGAWEDGIVAVGLCAAALPDAPQVARELAVRFLSVTDDHETADAIGWLLLGPSALARREWLAEALGPQLRDSHPIPRRAGVMALLAALPEPLTGPAVSALRARLGLRHLLFVDAPSTPAVEAAVALVVRDEDPHVRRAVGRVLRTWGQHDPDAVERYLSSVRGGLARWLREEAEQGIRRGRRKAPTPD